MKAYVITSGSVFALIALAHLWRAIAEGSGLLKSPVFIVLTAFAVALALWAWRVLVRLPRS